MKHLVEDLMNKHHLHGKQTTVERKNLSYQQILKERLL